MQVLCVHITYQKQASSKVIHQILKFMNISPPFFKFIFRCKVIVVLLFFFLTASMKAGRLTCEGVLKKMLFTIFRRGYEIRVRCEDRSFSLRDEVDWTWLDMQRGKVDINFIVDPALPDLEASEIIQLDRTTLRRRKFNKMLLLSRKEQTSSS